MKILISLVEVITLFLLVGCSSLQLQPADFSWPSEEVIDVSVNTMVEAKRYCVKFNIESLLEKEFSNDMGAVKKATVVRLIRDRAGFYFITAPHFKNVYVFKQGDGFLSLTNTIPVSVDQGMTDPKFNQRDSFLELVDGTQIIKLSKNGIQ